jgi:hypothetical protein
VTLRKTLLVSMGWQTPRPCTKLASSSTSLQSTPRVSYAVDRINRLDVLRLKAAFAICAFKKQAHIARLQNNPNSALELMAEAEKLEEVVEYFAAEIKAVRL